MAQNINLLGNLPKANKSFLTAKLYFQISGIWAGILIIIYIAALPSFHEKKNELANLQNEKNIIMQKIAYSINLVSKNSKQKLISPTDIEYSAVANLTKGYSTTGFSAPLETLSQDVPPGVWLENFSISINDNSASFSGQTISENLLPIFLANINNDKTFANKNFNKLNIQKNPVDKKIRFTITN